MALDTNFRPYVEGVRALLLASAVRPDDPLERCLTEIFGPRTDVLPEIPSADALWAMFADQVSTAGIAEDIVAGYWDHFPAFVAERYGGVLRSAWTESSRAAAFALLRRHVADPAAWHYLGLRFGFADGSVGTMTHEQIGLLIHRSEAVVDFAIGFAISTIRASSDAAVIRRLSGRF